MKIFNASYEATIDTDGLQSESVLAIAAAACEENGWAIDYASPSGILAYAKTGMVTISNEISICYTLNDVIIKSANQNGSPIDFGRNKRIVNRFIRSYKEQQSTLTVDEILSKYEELKSRFDDGEDYLAPEAYAQRNQKVYVLDFILPGKGYFATPVIAWLNIAVFILMLISGVSALSPETEAIYQWGGNYGPATLNGQWWRMLTCAFVHIGILHLLMNLYGLFYAGILLEPLIGTERFVMVYLLTALTSSVLSLHMHPDVVSAGASGAIFGLFGVLIAMLTTNLVHKQLQKTLLPNMAIFIGYSLLNGMREGVDNAGHIGGLVGGLIVGYALYLSVRKHASEKAQRLVPIAITIGIIAVVITGISVAPNPQGAMPEELEKYQKRMQKFAQFESMALEALKFSDTSKESILSELQDRGIYYWDECTKVLDSVQSMSLPEAILSKNQKMLHYVALRRRSYELAYKQIAENTNVYSSRIEELNNEIERSIIELGGALETSDN